MKRDRGSGSAMTDKESLYFTAKSAAQKSLHSLGFCSLLAIGVVL